MLNFANVLPIADKAMAVLFSSFPRLICAATEFILSWEKSSAFVVKSRSMGKALPYPAALPKGF